MWVWLKLITTPFYAPYSTIRALLPSCSGLTTSQSTDNTNRCTWFTCGAIDYTSEILNHSHVRLSVHREYLRVCERFQHARHVKIYKISLLSFIKVWICTKIRSLVMLNVLRPLQLGKFVWEFLVLWSSRLKHFDFKILSQKDIFIFFRMQCIVSVNRSLSTNAHATTLPV